MTRIPLAVAGEVPVGHVDAAGYIHLPGGWRVEWWIAGDDHWHVPLASASLRQRCVAHTPVVDTAMRVPGGDVVWRVGATATAEGAAIVCELENQASIPVAVGIAVVEPDSALDADVATARPSLRFTAPARSVAAELGVELLVHPVTHGSTFRCSIGALPPDALPPIEAIVRGWQALARQGAQVDFGDDTQNDALTAARTSLLLHAGWYSQPGRHRVTAEVRHTAALIASALTYLGHEDEAERVRVAGRLKPHRRGLPIVEPIEPDSASDPLLLHVDPALAAATVAALRAQLVADSKRRAVDVLPRADASWRGRSVDVTKLPTNSGSVSFALRWHGEYPALLWEAPKRVTLRAPALAPTWSAKAPSGEALLGVAREGSDGQS